VSGEQFKFRHYNPLILHRTATHMYALGTLTTQWDPSNTDTLGPLKCVLIRGVSSFQGANNTYLCEVGAWSIVLIREVSSFLQEGFHCCHMPIRKIIFILRSTSHICGHTVLNHFQRSTWLPYMVRIKLWSV